MNEGVELRAQLGVGVVEKTEAAIAQKDLLRGLSNKNFFWTWFVAVNVSLLAAVIFFPFAVFFPFIGIGGAVLSLFLSRWLAKRAHGIVLIGPETFRSAAEEELYGVVTELSRRAGLPVVPEVGVYKSPDMNAFATGTNQSSSLVAFSTGLLEKMPPDQIRAVAAHEIAHIANRDMVAMVLIQGVINSIVLACTLPINMLRALNWFSDQFTWAIELVLWLAKLAVAIFLTFLGSLVTKAYSRRREFRADELAARLVGPEAMASALETIAKDTTRIPRGQLAYASFKIAARPGLAELFSTHPAIERRIAALKALVGSVTADQPQDQTNGELAVED